MNWGSLQEFINMGGYGLYVWGSYAVTLALLLAELAGLASRKNSIKRQTSRRPIK
ncbi:MAG: heme exporter protein CcmD [Burkholderiales bacterium]